MPSPHLSHSAFHERIHTLSNVAPQRTLTTAEMQKWVDTWRIAVLGEPGVGKDALAMQVGTSRL